MYDIVRGKKNTLNLIFILYLQTETQKNDLFVNNSNSWHCSCKLHFWVSQDPVRQTLFPFCIQENKDQLCTHNLKGNPMQDYFKL